MTSSSSSLSLAVGITVLITVNFHGIHANHFTAPMVRYSHAPMVRVIMVPTFLITINFLGVRANHFTAPMVRYSHAPMVGYPHAPMVRVVAENGTKIVTISDGIVKLSTAALNLALEEPTIFRRELKNRTESHDSAVANLTQHLRGILRKNSTNVKKIKNRNRY